MSKSIEVNGYNLPRVDAFAGFLAASQATDETVVALLLATAEHGPMLADEVAVCYEAAGRAVPAPESLRVMASRWSAGARLAAVVGFDHASAVIRGLAQALRGRELVAVLPSAVGNAARAAKVEAAAKGAKPADVAAAAMTAAMPRARETAARVKGQKAASRAKVAAKSGKGAAAAPVPVVPAGGREPLPAALAALRPFAESALARIGNAELSPEDTSRAARVREVLADLLALLGSPGPAPATIPAAAKRKPRDA